MSADPLRVRVLYTRYPHLGPHSGFLQVFRYLDAAKIVVSRRPVSDGDDDWPLPDTPLNAYLRRVGTRRGMAWFKLSDLAAEIRTLPACLGNSVDIVHYLDSEHTGQYLQRWIRSSRVSRVCTIGTFHQPAELLVDLVNPASVRSLDLVIVLSPSQLEFFRGFLPPERVVHLPHGIDTSFFVPGEPRNSRPAFKCITAGHWLRDWRAMRDVAKIFMDQPNVEFHVVTNKDTGLDGLPNVQVHRNVTDESLRDLYQDADVLLLPLTNATANNSLLEGMASGLPVVTTALPAIAAYADSRCAFAIPHNDPRAIAEALRQLQANVALRTTMSCAARARAVELSWPTVASGLQEIYEGLAGRRRQPS